MFSHLKYLAAISLIIMITGAILVNLSANRYQKNETLTSASGHANAAIASYNAAIWERYASYIMRNPGSPYFTSFQQDSQRFFQPQPFVKITVFAPENPPLAYYNSSDETPTLDGTTRIPVFDINQVLKGVPVSRKLENVRFTGGANTGPRPLLIQSIIPIMRAGATSPDALVEIYSETSTGWDKLNLRLKQFMLVGIGIFTVLIAVLLITAKRAESIITKQHEINLELIAAAAQSEAQSRDKSQFLASVSHELRTPLNAIIGFSEIIRNEAKEKLDKIYQDYIEDIYASGKHLLSLINDILDFSKAEAGKLQIEWAEADVTKIIHNSLRMVLPRAEAAQVTLVEDIPTHHLVIVTDPKKLKQVLLNLLSNAVKFTRAGGEVRCHAWSDVVTGGLNIQVRDTGIGIAPKDISRVMTPFGQVDSALSRKYEGTGLGLPLSKKFVESMGGEFVIESELNVGTTITVKIPKAPPGWGAENTTKDENKDEADVSTEPAA